MDGAPPAPGPPVNLALILILCLILLILMYVAGVEVGRAAALKGRASYELAKAAIREATRGAVLGCGRVEHRPEHRAVTARPVLRPQT
jgi:hypothetical protein